MSLKSYQQIIDHLTPAEIDLLQTFAKNRVMEPFEGQAGLNALQETNLKLTSGINKIKDWNKSRKSKKEPRESFTEQLKNTPVSPILEKLGKLVSGVSTVTKSKLKHMEPVVRELMFDFLKKGLELSRNDDYDTWIIKRASEVLNRQISHIEQIKDISLEERRKLIEGSYPYRSQRYKLLLASFDKSVSIFLGAIVATNLPGTGILVSLINMVKTMIRMSNRINSLAVIYGRKVQNLSGLFELCAIYLNSIEDWDKNCDHIPLHPEILERLFIPDKGDFEAELAKFIEAAGNKELYIAVPGIGMLSLGKINLDNLKIDLLIENMMQDYHLLQHIMESCNRAILLDIIDDYKMIYQAFSDSDYFVVLKNKRSLERKLGASKSLGKFFKTMVGSEEELDILNQDFAKDARIVFNSVINLPKKDKMVRIKQLVEELAEG